MSELSSLKCSYNRGIKAKEVAMTKKEQKSTEVVHSVSQTMEQATCGILCNQKLHTAKYCARNIKSLLEKPVTADILPSILVITTVLSQTGRNHIRAQYCSIKVNSKPVDLVLDQNLSANTSYD
ncbi:F-box/LRR-repeat protein 2 [Platysternon megacephalum]|uniref:F-box/LRR-repeat protein 2 n=1 Tax=Platysternon megacephalum TaxID=55544 RepID=A0A4D9EEX5_9SAUR|nr:F-box/LRR-repeat protein 2 [Platysternon megacephalum]